MHHNNKIMTLSGFQRVRNPQFGREHTRVSLFEDLLKRKKNFSFKNLSILKQVQSGLQERTHIPYDYALKIAETLLELKNGHNLQKSRDQKKLKQYKDKNIPLIFRPVSKAILKFTRGLSQEHIAFKDIGIKGKTYKNAQSELYGYVLRQEKDEQYIQESQCRIEKLEAIVTRLNEIKKNYDTKIIKSAIKRIQKHINHNAHTTLTANSGLKSSVKDLKDQALDTLVKEYDELITKNGNDNQRVFRGNVVIPLHYKTKDGFLVYKVQKSPNDLDAYGFESEDFFTVAKKENGNFCVLEGQQKGNELNLADKQVVPLEVIGCPNLTVEIGQNNQLVQLEYSRDIPLLDQQVNPKQPRIVVPDLDLLSVVKYPVESENLGETRHSNGTMIGSTGNSDRMLRPFIKLLAQKTDGFSSHSPETHNPNPGELDLDDPDSFYTAFTPTDKNMIALEHASDQEKVIIINRMVSILRSENDLIEYYNSQIENIDTKNVQVSVNPIWGWRFDRATKKFQIESNRIFMRHFKSYKDEFEKELTNRKIDLNNFDGEHNSEYINVISKLNILSKKYFEYCQVISDLTLTQSDSKQLKRSAIFAIKKQILELNLSADRVDFKPFKTVEKFMPNDNEHMKDVNNLKLRNMLCRARVTNGSSNDSSVEISSFDENGEAISSEASVQLSLSLSSPENSVYTFE